MSTLTTTTSGVGQFGAMLATLWRRGADHFLRPRLVTAVGASDVGRVRENNEDYFLLADLARPAATVRGSDRVGAVTSSRPLLLVADGMGGAAGGEVASAMAANIICSQVELAAREHRLRTGAQWRKTLADAFVTANGRIRARGEADAPLRVGDSRAYVVRDGHARRLTKDHTWLQYLIDAGRPDDTEAGDPRRNALLRALGTQPAVTVDVTHAELRHGNTVILCTDGLWSAVDDGELARLVSAQPDLNALCQTLLALANDRGGQDNATVLAARMEP